MQIKRKTEQWKERTTPVIVAVLDTGIDEHHPKLKDKILVNYSKCFVAGNKISANFPDRKISEFLISTS